MQAPVPLIMVWVVCVVEVSEHIVEDVVVVGAGRHPGLHQLLVTVGSLVRVHGCLLTEPAA